jgi:ABC-type branched-subunit amino acid transport system substrate-binding protein
VRASLTSLMVSIINMHSTVGRPGVTVRVDGRPARGGVTCLTRVGWRGRARALRRGTSRHVCAPLLAALALLAGGCGSSSVASSPVPAGAPLRIGYLASLSGFCASYARQYVAGAELAVRQIDAHGGVLGHSLELIVRDDRGFPKEGMIQAQELVQHEHVKYLAGTCTSEVAKSVAQLVANPSHVIYLTGASDPGVFAGGPQVYAFDTIPTATIEGRLAASYMGAHPSWRRIAVIAEDYAYGRQVTAAFSRALRGSGETIVSRQYLPAGGADYTPYISSLLAAHPDAVYSSAIAGDALTLIGRGLARGLLAKAHLLTVADYDTLAAMPHVPAGAEGYTIYPTAAVYRTPFARELEPLGAKTANGGAAGDAFNQIEIIAQGIEKAGSTDPTKVRDALAGARVQTVQGDVQVRRCDHTLATPVAIGTIAGPTREQPFAHLEPVRLLATSGYREC